MSSRLWGQQLIGSLFHCQQLRYAAGSIEIHHVCASIACAIDVLEPLRREIFHATLQSCMTVRCQTYAESDHVRFMALTLSCVVRALVGDLRLTERFDTPGVAVPGVCASALTCGIAELESERIAFKEPAHGGLKLIGIEDEKARLSRRDQLRQSTFGNGHDGLGGCHGLQRHQPELLFIWQERQKAAAGVGGDERISGERSAKVGARA